MTTLEMKMANDTFKEHEFHDEYDENCSECYEKEKCHLCHDKGYITKTEWADDDRDYEVEIRCSCQED